MSIHDFIPLITALAPYSWPITVLILAWSFRNRIKEIIELKVGDKLSVRWGDAPSDRKLEQVVVNNQHVLLTSNFCLLAHSGIGWATCFGWAVI